MLCCRTFVAAFNANCVMGCIRYSWLQPPAPSGTLGSLSPPLNKHNEDVYYGDDGDGGKVLGDEEGPRPEEGRRAKADVRHPQLPPIDERRPISSRTVGKGDRVPVPFTHIEVPDEQEIVSALTSPAMSVPVTGRSGTSPWQDSPMHTNTNTNTNTPLALDSRFSPDMPQVYANHGASATGQKQAQVTDGNVYPNPKTANGRSSNIYDNSQSPVMRTTPSFQSSNGINKPPLTVDTSRKSPLPIASASSPQPTTSTGQHSSANHKYSSTTTVYQKPPKSMSNPTATRSPSMKHMKSFAAQGFDEVPSSSASDTVYGITSSCERSPIPNTAGTLLPPTVSSSVNSILGVHAHPHLYSNSVQQGSPDILASHSSLHRFPTDCRPPRLSELATLNGVIFEGWLEKKSIRTGFWHKVRICNHCLQRQFSLCMSVSM